MCTKIAMWLCGSSNVAASLATHGRMSSIRAIEEKSRIYYGSRLANIFCTE